MSKREELAMRQIRADHAWGFCQSMGVKNLDIPTEKGSKVTLVELLSEYRSEALRTLASGMKKVLSPETLEELRWSCDPLGEFVATLRAAQPKEK